MNLEDILVQQLVRKIHSIDNTFMSTAKTPANITKL